MTDTQQKKKQNILKHNRHSIKKKQNTLKHNITSTTNTIN